MAPKKSDVKKSAQPAGETTDAEPGREPQDEDVDKKKPDPLGQFWTSLGLTGPEAQERMHKAARVALQPIIDEHDVARNYNILLLYDETSLVRGDADNIYRAIRAFEEPRDVLLLLHSTGGEVAPAYLISQLCREHAKEKFLTVIPRRAKSAATLLACGADEIHLGSMSELGPIDPQIGRHPALGLGNALRHIAELVSDFPDASEMFAEYLARTVPPIDLGYYERVAESATQYAERLLSSHAATLERPPNDVAQTLVYSYKDHGFVIDKSEAKKIFGDEMIVTDSEEYLLANAIYDRLSILNWMCDYRGYRFYWVGSPDSNCQIYRPPE